jgi:hypothetical protein
LSIWKKEGACSSVHRLFFPFVAPYVNFLCAAVLSCAGISRDSILDMAKIRALSFWGQLMQQNFLLWDRLRVPLALDLAWPILVRTVGCMQKCFIVCALFSRFETQCASARVNDGQVHIQDSPRVINSPGRWHRQGHFIHRKPFGSELSSYRSVVVVGKANALLVI